ncbi:MAG TPA: ECF transporter S component [Bacillota bacterium]|nr:ECF transporter S component [Bacillota bacterium]HPT35457.1 ECF transporter S component [Bacillota bacterium]HPZ84871.1 ECF transporter S component [Bacillota bacterium]HQD85427.1 ECF transporter S component [Bacillota bacterium]
MRGLDVRNMTIGALLLALSLIIPLALGGVLGVVIGPFSATLASHVPIMISMLFGPGVAGTVALGSAIGFFVKLGPVVGMRAAMHIPVAILGAILLKRQLSYPLVLAITGPIHALLEGLIVQPFLMFGSSMLYGESQPLALFYLVAGGTLLHHAMDGVIAVFCWRLMKAFQKGVNAKKLTVPSR